MSGSIGIASEKVRKKEDRRTEEVGAIRESPLHMVYNLNFCVSPDNISLYSILSVLTRGNYQLSIINYQLMNATSNQSIVTSTTIQAIAT